MTDQEYEKGVRYQTIRALEDRYNEGKWFNFYSQTVRITSVGLIVLDQGQTIYSFELSNGSRIVLEELS